ncbi:fumarylacetoacetate hydrolase, partial [Rhizobium ruizarguesonis]
MSQALLDVAASDGLFVGRIWNPEVAGPSIVTSRKGVLVDITSREAPTLSALLERQDAAGFVRAASGKAVGSLADIAANSTGAPDQTRPYLLAPVDLQAVKACGVTFAQSMIERVIEEKAAGNPERAASIRERVSTLIGGSLTNLKAGSPEAAKVKQALIDEGMWSQYLEVGIGPDAEVFT